MHYKNIVGQKFSRLTVLKLIGRDKHQSILWLCECECGNKIKVNTTSLKTGNTKSCGCLQKEKAIKTLMSFSITHGLSRDANGKKTRLFRIWNGIKTRCLNPNTDNYSSYGARGIKMCKEWISDFKEFHDWAINNGYSDNLTVDRIDNNGNYAPNNCRWATFKTQANNKSNNVMLKFKGHTLNLKQWSETLNMNYRALEARLRRGWSIEKTLTTQLK